MIYIPHEAVYVELEGRGLYCSVCGKEDGVHPEYYDRDVDVEDEEQ